MKEHILDSGFFVATREYFPETFPSFWEEMDKLVQAKIVSSVDEVFEEIQKYGGAQEHLLKWMRNNRQIFTIPSPVEEQKVRQILSIQRFQKLVSSKARLRGSRCADPFVIAKAMAIQGTVVTKETPAPRDKNGNIQGKHKIPDVCQHFNIPCITPQEFMRAQRWVF